MSVFAVIALSNISHPGGRAPVAAIKSLTCTVCVLTSACLLLALQIIFLALAHFTKKLSSRKESQCPTIVL